MESLGSLKALRAEQARLKAEYEKMEVRTHQLNDIRNSALQSYSSLHTHLYVNLTIMGYVKTSSIRYL